MQSLVTEIRAAGYTNPILFDKWNQAWTLVNDPLDNTFQGYHFYFNSWSVSGAMSQMQTAQSKGIKLINTEIGADYNEYNSFTTSTVAELNQFLSQSASMGIGNTVWMNENLNNMPRYQQLGLDFPTVTSPISTSPNPTQSPTTTPRPTTSPTSTPSPTTSPNPTPSPTATPHPTSSPNPTSYPTPSPTTSPNPTPYPTPTPSTPPTTSIFQDGFESGSTSSWTSTTRTSRDTVSVTNSMPYSGSYNARFYTSGSTTSRENAALRKTINNQPDVYSSACFRIVGSTTGTQILQNNNDRFYLLRFTNDNAADLALAGIRREGGVNKWILFAGNRYIASTAIPINVDQWYDVKLHWDSETNLAEMYVNGVKILQMTATSGDTSSATIAEMGIRYTYSVQNPILLCADNFRLSNTP